MQEYCLIGSPIAHSLSPRMMNTSFSKLGIDAVYGLCETDAAQLPDTVARLKARGVSGWNVTMPCKEAMAGLCDELSLASRIGGAVNTVKNENGRLIGHTTDGIGLVWALGRAGIMPCGNAFTLFGSGGAATAILIQLALDHAASVSVFVRSPSSKEKVRAIAEKLAAHTDTRIALFSYADRDAMRRALMTSRALIQATPVGMDKARPGAREVTDTAAGAPGAKRTSAAAEASGGAFRAEDCLIPDESFIPKDLYVYDIIYHPASTPLLRLAEKAGARCGNGVAMLVGQGAASFSIWTGRTMPADDLIRDLFR